MKKVAIPMEELVPLLQLQMQASGSAVLTVTGYSMMPMLHNRRDTVVLTPVQARQRKGDLILYRRENGQYVLHRILRVKKDGYILCGDNQFFTERVKDAQLLAAVSGFTRGGKFYGADHRGYRRYVFWWVALHPIRWLYLIPRRALGSIRTAIRHRRFKKSGGKP